MLSKTWNAMLIVAAATSLMSVAVGQTPRGAPPLDTYAMFPTTDPVRLRTMTILQQGLAEVSLNFSREQKAEINKAVDAFVADLVVLNEKQPVEARKPIPAATLQARQSAVGKLDLQLARVMTAQQRQLWESGKAARRKNLESTLSTRPHQER